VRQLVMCASLLSSSVISAKSAYGNNELELDVYTADQLVAMHVDQKAIKKLATFIVSKKTVRTLHGYFTRSAKPSKKLLRGFFFNCDFHKTQLLDFKECINEALALASISAPLVVRLGFTILEHPAIKNYIAAMEQVAQDEALVEKTNAAFINYMDDLENNLAAQDPVSFAALKEQSAKCMEWGTKWNSSFIPAITDYIFARCTLRQKQLDHHLASFAHEMLWKHIGPTIGLAIAGYWKSRKLLGKDNADEVIFSLLKELHKKAVEDRAILEPEIVASFQASLKTYHQIINGVIDESLARA